MRVSPAARRRGAQPRAVLATGLLRHQHLAAAGLPLGEQNEPQNGVKNTRFPQEPIRGKAKKWFCGPCRLGVARKVQGARWRSSPSIARCRGRSSPSRWPHRCCAWSTSPRRLKGTQRGLRRPERAPSSPLQHCTPLFAWDCRTAGEHHGGKARAGVRALVRMRCSCSPPPCAIAAKSFALKFYGNEDWYSLVLILLSHLPFSH